MTRRGFLSRLLALPIAAVLAIKIPARPQIERPSLAINRPPEPTPENRFGIRFIRQYEVQADRFPARLDVLYGIGTLRPNFAVRVAG